ncbi:MAG TPA: hypothetical protein VHD36_01400 [Pirellulales bacterium]|nr:hypothetical protein [Pirellulales bacterium]
MTIRTATAERYRIWIAKFQDWQPRSWRDLPREAVAVELAESGCFSANDALAYIEGFNRVAIGRSDHRWAVAMPVIAYEGDPAPGELIFPRKTAMAPSAG